MDFMKIMDLMNYNYESKGTELYRICKEFINANNEILTENQLKEFQASLLPPQAFDDGRERTGYNGIQDIIKEVLYNNIEKKEKGMGA